MTRPSTSLYPTECASAVFTTAGEPKTGLRRIVTALAYLVDLPLGWRDRARQRRYLQSMDDAMLRDVGLSRSDVEFESTKPFWRL